MEVKNLDTYIPGSNPGLELFLRLQSRPKSLVTNAQWDDIASNYKCNSVIGQWRLAYIIFGPVRGEILVFST